jgi:hypothetical protein
VPAIVLIVVIGSSSAKGNKRQNVKGSPKAGNVRGTTEKRERGYSVSAPGEPAETGAIPGPVGIDADAHRMEAIGEVRPGDPPLPRLNLKAAWARDQVTLDWSRPGFDPAIYRLDGYEVSVLKYGPGDTVPVKTLVAKLSPDTIQWMSHYNQTYRFSTGGDLNGYVVDALLRHITNTGQNEIMRIGATAFAPAH